MAKAAKFCATLIILLISHSASSTQNDTENEKVYHTEQMLPFVKSGRIYIQHELDREIKALRDPKPPFMQSDPTPYQIEWLANPDMWVDEATIGRWLDQSVPFYTYEGELDTKLELALAWISAKTANQRYSFAVASRRFDGSAFGLESSLLAHPNIIYDMYQHITIPPLESEIPNEDVENAIPEKIFKGFPRVVMYETIQILSSEIEKMTSTSSTQNPDLTSGYDEQMDLTKASQLLNRFRSEYLSARLFDETVNQSLNPVLDFISGRSNKKLEALKLIAGLKRITTYADDKVRTLATPTMLQEIHPTAKTHARPGHEKR